MKFNFQPYTNWGKFDPKNSSYNLNYFYISHMNPIYSFLTALICVSLFSISAHSQCVPFFGHLVINEVMPANSTTATDENGEYDDWVELYNATDQPINLNGYFLSDSHGNETKYVFPDVDIDANGYLIIWCDNQIDQGEFHAPFRLSSSGEEVGLYNPDTTSVDYVRFGNTPSDISIGRYPNGAGPFNKLIPTFNSANTNSVSPGLVINEYQAINETTAQDQWGEYADWVELYNNDDQPINLAGYFLSDKIGDPTQFQFPDTVLNADSYLIIWCDMGLQEPGLHTFFKLGSDGDDILLSNADTLTLDYVRYGPQIPDDSEGRYGNGIGPIACMIPTFSENNGSPTGLTEKTKRDLLKVWPNPAVDYIWIESPNLNNEVVRLYDMNGRLVLQGMLKSGELSFDLQSLNPGMYFVLTETQRAKIVVN